MTQPNPIQSVVMSLGANRELLVHRNGFMSVAPAIRQIMTVARSLNEVFHATNANADPLCLRCPTGLYYHTKDYSHDNVSANFLAHDLELGQGRDNIENEIAVLWLCSNSKQIVHLHTVYQESPAVRPALTMKRVAGVSLQEILQNQPVVPEQDVKLCIRDILRALGDLHKLGIAHLDLKPQKVLLVGGRFGEGVKLCGFRFARMVGEEIRIMRNLTIDTDYRAMEVILAEAVSTATDIWSVGVMAYQMLMGRLPFLSTNFQLTLDNMMKHHVICPTRFADSLRGHMSPEAVNFIDRCTIVREQSDRLTVEQCLAHPWLADVPDPWLMLRTLAEVCAHVSTASDQGSIQARGGRDRDNYNGVPGWPYSTGWPRQFLTGHQAPDASTEPGPAPALNREPLSPPNRNPEGNPSSGSAFLQELDLMPVARSQ